MTRRHIVLKTGLFLTAFFVAAALLALLWTPYDVAAVEIASRLAPPSAAHWLGTDQYGRDMLSLLMAGATTSLGVSLLSVGAAILIGVPLGLYAAAKSGVVDGLIMRFGDLVFAFPSLMLAIILSALLGPGASNAIIAIAIFNIPVFARLTRGEARRVWSLDYIAAARIAGKGAPRISFEHILPNISAPLLVQATIQFALALIAEAGLSYVGLGVQSPQPSWGRMLAESQTLIGTAPQLAILPGAAILLTVFGLTLLGDGLGDALRGEKGA
jgi:peptide/nickel transport system permease protein